MDEPSDTENDEEDDGMVIISESNPVEQLPTQAEVVFDVARSVQKNTELSYQARYHADLARLQGTVVPVTHRKTKSVVNWRVSNEAEVLDDKKTTRKDDKIGLQDFNFKKLEVPDHKGRVSRINLMKLMYALFPGNIKQLLFKLNA